MNPFLTAGKLAPPAVLLHIPENNTIMIRSLKRGISSPNIEMCFYAKDEDDGDDEAMLGRKTTEKKQELSRISWKMNSFGECPEVGDWRRQSLVRGLVPLVRYTSSSNQSNYKTRQGSPVGSRLFPMQLHYTTFSLALTLHYGS